MRIAPLAALVAALVLAGNAGAVRPPHLKMWLCVHRQEHTAWNDPNPPYFGGLQMGMWFIGHYAHPPGTPDQWTPMQQMWVAENAWRRERYSVSWLYGQWPPSRGVCF
jgi:hypothetical protein